MRAQFTGLVSRCDLFSVPVGLKAGAQGKMRSFLAGTISIIIGVFFIFFFVARVIEVVNNEKISYKNTIEKIRNKSSVRSSFTTFAFGADSLTNIQFLSMFTPTINVHINKQILQQFSLEICNIDRWPGLSQAQFDQFGLEDLLCPKNDDPFNLVGTYRSQKPDYITLTVRGCKIPPSDVNYNNVTDEYVEVDPQIYFTCLEEEAKQYIITQTKQSRGMEFFFYIYDVAVFENQIPAIQRIINFDIKAIVNQRLGEEVYVQWATVIAETDVSIYPWTKIQKQNNTFIENIRSAQFPIDVNNLTGNPIAIVTFTMNDKLITYKRSVEKLTQAFASTGGLFSFIVPIVGIIIIRYNSYNYDLQVAKSTFREDEQAEKPPSSTNLWIFIKYAVYSFIKRVCCCKPNWEDCIEISCRKREAVSLMEIGRIFKRIQYLETAMKYSISKSEAACLIMTQQQTLVEARRSRLEASYYTAVTNERSQVAICDLRRTYNAFGLSLEQFYKTKLENKINKKSKGAEDRDMNKNGEVFLQFKTIGEIQFAIKDTINNFMQTDGQDQVDEI